MAGGRLWGDDELEWLAGWYPSHTLAETVEEHNRLFCRRGPTGISSKASQLGIRRDVRRIRWTPEMDAWLRSFAPGHSEAEIAAALGRRFGVEATRDQISNRKTALGVKSGTKGGQFKKGQPAWNKGKTWDDYMPAESQESCRRTCYRKGNMPWNGEGKPIGYMRVTRDGYIEIKVRPRPSRPDRNDNFALLHRVLWCWRRHVRKVPDGHVVVFANRDRRDFSPDNLVLVARRNWGAMNRRGLAYGDAGSLAAAESLVELSRAMGEAGRR